MDVKFALLNDTLEEEVYVLVLRFYVMYFNDGKWKVIMFQVYLSCIISYA